MGNLSGKFKILERFFYLFKKSLILTNSILRLTFALALIKKKNKIILMLNYLEWDNMRNIFTLMLSLMIMIFCQSFAQAANFCWFGDGGLLVDGGTSTNYLKITVSSVPREVYPGHGADRVWCRQTRTSLGGHGSNKLIEPPKLGEVRLGSYWINYKGNKVGHDRFVVERTWLNGINNNVNKGTLIYEVDVVPDSF